MGLLRPTCAAVSLAALLLAGACAASQPSPAQPSPAQPSPALLSTAEPSAARPATERPSSAADDAVFVGRSSDGALTVAVAVHDGRATGLVDNGAGCGVWFDGASAGGLLDLAGVDGTTLLGAIHGRVVHGGVRGGFGGDRSFTAVQAAAPAGLYAAVATSGDDRIGWVRFADGTTTGAADVGGRRTPAPEMGPDIEVDGVRFTPPSAVIGGAVIRP